MTFLSERATSIIFRPLRAICLAVCAVAVASSATAQPAPGSGRLEGIVVREDGSGVGGVLVLIEELGKSELTDVNGRYAFGGIPAGTYRLLSALGPQSLQQSGVVVSAGTTTTLRAVVDWPVSVFESVLVNGTTRLPERLVEAPAAATVLGSDELAAQAPHGQPDQPPLDRRGQRHLGQRRQRRIHLRPSVVLGLAGLGGHRGDQGGAPRPSRLRRLGGSSHDREGGGQVERGW